MPMSSSLPRFSIFYEMTEPVFVMMDPELIKAVMVKDFDHFMDFGFNDPIINRLEENNFGLVNLMGEDWKKVRSVANKK